MGHKCGSYEDGVALKYEYLYRMESTGCPGANIYVSTCSER